MVNSGKSKLISSNVHLSATHISTVIDRTSFPSTSPLTLTPASPATSDSTTRMVALPHYSKMFYTDRRQSIDKPQAKPSARRPRANPTRHSRRLRNDDTIVKGFEEYGMTLNVKIMGTSLPSEALDTCYILVCAGDNVWNATRLLTRSDETLVLSGVHVEAARNVSFVLCEHNYLGSGADRLLAVTTGVSLNPDTVESWTQYAVKMSMCHHDADSDMGTRSIVEFELLILVLREKGCPFGFDKCHYAGNSIGPVTENGDLGLQMHGAFAFGAGLGNYLTGKKKEASDDNTNASSIDFGVGVRAGINLTILDYTYDLALLEFEYGSIDNEAMGNNFHFDVLGYKLCNRDLPSFSTCEKKDNIFSIEIDDLKGFCKEDDEPDVFERRLFQIPFFVNGVTVEFFGDISLDMGVPVLPYVCPTSLGVTVIPEVTFKVTGGVNARVGVIAFGVKISASITMETPIDFGMEFNLSSTPPTYHPHLTSSWSVGDPEIEIIAFFEASVTLFGRKFEAAQAEFPIVKLDEEELGVLNVKGQFYPV